ncbi:MAG TPA: glycyl-radical enzyme activating protein [Candidatus Cloacimonadota bacterium]|nr:glycyl-radical enzyme activating protein [Candidatus Cloacimonadota bacterium]
MIKGMICDIKRFAVHDGPGIRTTVFLKGCPLHCRWCHNPESIDPKQQTITKKISLDGKFFNQPEIIGKEMSVREVMTEILKDRIFFGQSGGGVTFSGGEPLLQSAFLKEIMSECKKENLHVTLDTCGFAVQKNLESILDFIDLFLFDLKIVDEEKHQEFTGVSNHPILQNLEFLISRKQNVIIRLPIIPQINDENIDEISDLLKKYPEIREINLLPYHDIAAEKYHRLGMQYHKFSQPSAQKMNEINRHFTHAGFDVKIGG